MTTAFQANSLAPMGWNLEPESKIDRHHHCSTSIVVWTDSCTRLFGPRWVGVWMSLSVLVSVWLEWLEWLEWLFKFASAESRNGPPLVDSVPAYMKLPSCSHGPTETLCLARNMRLDASRPEGV